jgi:hypothetical protein
MVYEGVSVKLGVAVKVSVNEGVGVGVHVSVNVGVSVGVLVQVSVAVGVSVSVKAAVEKPAKHIQSRPTPHMISNQRSGRLRKTMNPPVIDKTDKYLQLGYCIMPSSGSSTFFQPSAQENRQHPQLWEATRSRPIFGFSYV